MWAILASIWRKELVEVLADDGADGDRADNKNTVQSPKASLIVLVLMLFGAVGGGVRPHAVGRGQ